MCHSPCTVLELCSLYRGIHHEFSRGNPIYNYFWRFQLRRSNNCLVGMHQLHLLGFCGLDWLCKAIFRQISQPFSKSLYISGIYFWMERHFSISFFSEIAGYLKNISIAYLGQSLSCKVADQPRKILLNYIPQNNTRMQYVVYNWGCLLLIVRLFLAKNGWSLISVFLHRTVGNILEKCYYCISLYCTFFIQYEVNVLSWYIVLPFRWSLQLTSLPLLDIKEHVKISSFEKETFKLFSLIQSFLLYETLQNFTLTVLNGFFCGGGGGGGNSFKSIQV